MERGLWRAAQGGLLSPQCLLTVAVRKTFFDVGSVSIVEGSIGERAGQAVVLLPDLRAVAAQAQGEVRKRSVVHAVATLASEPGDRVEDNTSRDVARVKRLLPVGLIPGVVAFVAEKLLMSPHEVTVPWQEAANIVHPVGLNRVRVSNLVPARLGVGQAVLRGGVDETELGLDVGRLLVVAEVVPCLSLVNLAARRGRVGISGSEWRSDGKCRKTDRAGQKRNTCHLD